MEHLAPLADIKEQLGGARAASAGSAASLVWRIRPSHAGLHHDTGRRAR
jgi:hypothetical protein